MSDTHGNSKFLRQSITNEDDIDVIIHLGDNYEDLLNNEDLFEDKQIFYVPGFFDPGYLPNTLPHIIKTDFLGWRFLMCHCLEESVEHQEGMNIVLYGHTHRPLIVQKESRYMINPGHLKNAFDRGNLATYAIMEICEDVIKIFWRGLDGKEISFADIDKNSESV